MHGELKDIINGFILGDGSVFRDRDYFRFKLTAKDMKYLEWVAELFVRNGINTFFSNDKRNDTCILYARTNDIFHGFRKNWYTKINGKTQKIVPKDLELNSTVLLHWYIGDGCLIRQKENRIPRIVLATNAFSKENINLLIEKLRKIGLNFYPILSYSGFTKNKCGYILTSKLEDGTPFRFFKIIGFECPKEIKDCYTGNKGRGSKRHYVKDKWPNEEDRIRIFSNVNGIGKIIKERRGKLKISQGQLAKKVDTTRDYIKQIERGRRYPSVPLFKKILSAIKIDISYFLEYT
jgi:DNA-binding XRE family transcriptional regulator